MDQDNIQIPNINAPESNNNPSPAVEKIPQPISQPQAPFTPVPPKPQKPKGLIVAIIILAILAIISIAFGVYGMFLKPAPKCEANCENISNTPTDNDTETSTTTETENDPSIDYDSTIRDLISKLQDTTSSLSYSYNIIPTYDRGYVLVKNASAKTLLPLRKTYGLYGMTQGADFAISDEFVNIINNKLTELGFVNNEDIEGPTYLTGGTNLINRDAQIACTLSGGIPFTVFCGHLSWLAEDTIATANQLAEAYHEKTGEYPFSLSAERYNIQNSQISPYQTLSTGVGNAMGLFYRTSPEANWQFLKITQSGLHCSDFDTEDSRKAFSGEQCYDETTGQQSTVQP